MLLGHAEAMDLRTFIVEPRDFTWSHVTSLWIHVMALTELGEFSVESRDFARLARNEHP